MKLPPAARISWNVFPPSVLISSTPPSKPTLGSISDASRLKFCRNVNCGEAAEKGKCSESSRLSLSTGGSLTHAALGAVSAAGLGSPEFEVCQKIPSGSIAFVAIQSEGRAGGVTLSKFSLNTTGYEQGGEHEARAAGCGAAA